MKPERRFLTTNLRAKSTGTTRKLMGYVARFNELSGDLGGFREKIAPGAFAESIKNDDIRALFNHDSNFVLGRTSAGTLNLFEDAKGLMMEVVLPDTQAARDLWQSVSRGDITSQSFSFNAIRDEYKNTPDGQIRTLLEVKLFDVGPVTFPAYESSDIQARQRALTNTSKGDIQMTTPELLEEKGRIVKEMRDINDKYQPGQAYSAEHEESYRRMERRLDEINQLLRRERLEREQIAASESGASVSRGAVGNMDSDFHEEVRARSQGAIRNIQPGELRGFFPPNPDGERRISLKAMQLPSDDQELRDVRAFLRGGRIGIPEDVRQRFEVRALQADLDVAGGYLVGEQLAAQVVMSLEDAVFMRRLATVLLLPDANSLGVVALESDPEDADWTAELRTGTKDSDMDFGKRELRPHPLAKRIKASKTLIRKAPNCEQIIRQRLAYKFAVPEEKAFLTGTGVGQPLGIFTASNSGISTARDVSTGNTSTAIKADNLIECAYTLKSQYRRNARWIFHRDTIKMIRKLKDGEGNYLWKMGLSADRPDTILGHPFMESEYAPNTFTTGKYVGALGDWSYYWIADSLSMQIQVLLELYAESNQNGYIGRKETDGMPVLEEAFVRVTLA